MKRTVSELYELRRDNIRRLFETESKTALAKRMGVTPSMLSQIAGPKPTRTIAEKQARDIEHKLGLDHGWLDLDHDARQRIDVEPEDTVPFLGTIDTLADACTRNQWEPRMRQFVALCHLTFHHLRSGAGKLTPVFLDSVIEVVRKST